MITDLKTTVPASYKSYKVVHSAHGDRDASVAHSTEVTPRKLGEDNIIMSVMNKLVVDGNSRMTLFTGSQDVAEKLSVDLHGKVRLEDAGDVEPTVSARRFPWRCESEVSNLQQTTQT